MEHITGIAIVAVGLVGLILAALAAAQKLPMNSTVGFRSSSTMSSKPAWWHSHQKAAGWVLLGGVGAVAAGIVELTVDDARGLPAVWYLGGVAWFILMVTIAGKKARRSAQQFQEQTTLEECDTQGAPS